MRRFPPLTAAAICSRLRVDVEGGRCYWLDATKHHRNLVGHEAGSARIDRNGKKRWVIKINGIPYKRAQIILAVATGTWPAETVDHKDGNSLNDKATNLRHATVMQNAWNHKSRAKSSAAPMGVRRTQSGRYQARISCNKKLISLGVFSTEEQASTAYQAARKEYFHEFC